MADEIVAEKARKETVQVSAPDETKTGDEARLQELDGNPITGGWREGQGA